MPALIICRRLIPGKTSSVPVVICTLKTNLLSEYLEQSCFFCLLWHNQSCPFGSSRGVETGDGFCWISPVFSWSRAGSSAAQWGGTDLAVMVGELKPLCFPPSFNRIDIPAYESYEKLYEKLLTAIEETCGFAVEWPCQPLPDSIYTPVSQKALPSLSQDSRNAWNTGNFPFSTLGHWEGKDNFWIFFFKVF